MEECVIEVNPSNGQLTMCNGAAMLESIWDNQRELQARDRLSGDRYMLRVMNDRVTARRVVMH